MKIYNIDYYLSNLHEQIDLIINHYKTDKVLEATILLVTEMIDIKLKRRVDINIKLAFDGKNIELIFIYRSQFYDPVSQDPDAVYTCGKFLRHYYDDISHEYKDDENRLIFKGKLLTESEMEKKYINPED